MSGEGRMLSDVPWEDLRVGDRVRSFRNTIGVIEKLDPDDDCTVHILWDGTDDHGNPRHSLAYHHQAQLVWWLGRKDASVFAPSRSDNVSEVSIAELGIPVEPSSSPTPWYDSDEIEAKIEELSIKRVAILEKIQNTNDPDELRCLKDELRRVDDYISNRIFFLELMN